MSVPNASPSGIAGLMQKPPGQVPGQQPMPSPNKASPMAGLGSVDDRVSAYAGNAKPLEQRYAMTQDLLDLLALQKIKSQKDAAARQMQLQMAQQGQQDGQANMTVADQRAQEVDALTKNELAAQRGDTAQKQTGDQQAMMQKLMGGIAGAPGANAAAQPKMMATGGIVGYAGPEGSQVEDPLEAARQRAQQSLAKLRTYGLRQRQQDPEGYKAAEQESQQAQEAVAAAERALTGGPAGVMRRPMSMPTAPAPVRPPVSEAQATAAAGPQAAVPPASVVAAAQPPRPPAPPAAPKPPGIAGLPGAAAAPGAAAPPAPADDFGQRVKKAELGAAELDYMKQGRDEEARVEKRLALTPEQRGVYEEGIGGLQKMYQEQYDPERQQREGLKRALIGAGGRRYGEFAGAATAGMAYDDQQRAAKLKEFGDVQKARTGLIDLDRGAVKSGLEAGAATAKEGAATQRQGLAGAASVYSTDVGSRDKALDREVERLKTAISAEANRIQREGLDQNRATAQISNIEKWVTSEVGKLEDRMQKDPRIGMLMMKPADKLTPIEKNELESAQIAVKQAQRALEKKMEPVLAAARSKLGLSATTMSPEDKATIEKYTKGK